ncbi:plastocyanin/azurin family copper-binding protein [Halobacteria archaeon HArc-gm2]|nr:plastocyanin/azurin family copper-binding protein [Halobacteria archaeon HArc-gm2]
MSDPTLTRRRMAALAGASAASLAGCSGILNDSSPEEATDAGSGGGGSDGAADETGAGDDGSGGGGDGSDSENGSEATDGSDADGTETIPLQSEPRDSLTVSMVAGEDGTKLQFDPPLVWVKTGGTVTWGLESGNHSVTAYHPDNDRPQRIPEDASSFDSDVLAESNPTFEHTFETPGVYDYYCEPHRANGMVGTVVVGRPDPDGQSGLADPQDELLDAASESITRLNERTRELLEDAD